MSLTILEPKEISGYFDCCFIRFGSSEFFRRSGRSTLLPGSLRQGIYRGHCLPPLARSLAYREPSRIEKMVSHLVPYDIYNCAISQLFLTTFLRKVLIATTF